MGRDESREGFRRGVILCFSFRGDWRFCFFFGAERERFRLGTAKLRTLRSWPAHVACLLTAWVGFWSVDRSKMARRKAGAFSVLTRSSDARWNICWSRMMERVDTNSRRRKSPVRVASKVRAKDQYALQCGNCYSGRFPRRGELRRLSVGDNS
jgi:hypothetical protein